jgi:hypothetical protein
MSSTFSKITLVLLFVLIATIDQSLIKKVTKVANLQDQNMQKMNQIKSRAHSRR